MKRYTLPVIVVLLIAVLATALATAGGGTRAAEDPWSKLPPLIKAPEVTPSPERPQAPAPTNAPQSVPLFQDSFDSAESEKHWQAIDLVELGPGIEPARWGVRDGVMVQLWSGEHYTMRPDGTLAVAGDPAWSDYVFQAQAYAEFNSEMGLVFRWSEQGFYRLRMTPEVLENTPKVRLEKVVAGEVTLLDELAGPGYEPYRWYTITITAQGAQISAEIEGLGTLTAQDETLSQGAIGLYSLALGHMQFDNVVVTTP